MQGFELLARRHLLQREAHTGRLLPEMMHGAVQEGHQPGRRGEADAQLPAASASSVPQGEARRFYLGQDTAGAVQQEPAGRGQEHALSAPLKQRHVQLPLQRLDGLAQRRLADAQPFGGPPEVQLLRNRDEVTHPAQVQ